MSAKTDKAIPAHPLDWMPKSAWGPMKWKELHCRALAYLPMEGEQGWFDSFVESIPCSKCKHHFESYLKQNPPFEKPITRPEFFQWTVDAHNYVNRQLRKKELTYAEALLANAEQWTEGTEIQWLK